MSSDKHCCVPGCKDSGAMHRCLHGFPNPEKDRDRFNTWLYSIGSDILGLENDRIFKHRRVCHSHFEQKYVCRYHRLSNIAVPTLNIPGPLSPKRLRHQITNNLRQMQQTATSTSHQLEAIQGTSSGAILSSKMSGPCKTYGKRKPMQEIVNQPGSPTPSDLTLLETTISGDIRKETCKENVAPVTLQRECSANVLQISLDKKDHNMHGARTAKAVKKRTKKIFMSKKEQEMHKRIVSAQVKLSKMKNKIKKQSAQIKAAKKCISNPAATDFFQNSSNTAKLLIKLQGRENKKKEKGRRFTLAEKIASLSIFKQSPKGYRFLRKIFILPAEQTLVKLIHRSNLKPGLNKNIMSQLKKKAESMKTAEKLCVILFDEVSLKANIMYNERKEKIMGVVDNGDRRSADFADHAQVFMVRGLINNYKQPVYYTFSRNATKGPELARQIKEIVTGVQEAGLIVVATVCDQGANNRQALKLLLNETRGVYLRRQEEPKTNIVLINNQEIVPLYDPPHLLKGIRNNLITKNLIYTTNDGVKKTAKWSHLQQLLKENPGYKGIRLIPKLTENHINPEKMNKMKVKIATQVFSRTVASNMGYLADKGILPEDCKETADLLLFMDSIFDSVNGSFTKNKNAKPLLGPATPNSLHHKTWQEGKKVFQSMAFITPGGKKESVPTVENWVWTLEGIQVLLKKLLDDYQISSVWLRHLNQDPLENFFGAVRSHGCRNVNPTCDQFESAFATLLINNINSVHTRGKNCEADYCNTLQALIINENAEAASSEATFDFADLLELELVPIEVKENDPRKYAPIQYMSGYFLKKAKSNIFKMCAECTSDLSSRDEIEYIRYREYEKRRRWLCTPSNELVKMISNMQDIINEMMKTKLESPNLKQAIKTAVLIIVDFRFIKCNVHKDKVINYLINIVIRCLLHNYCKNINQILAGRRQVDDDEDDLQVKAKKHNRCYKRHK